MPFDEDDENFGYGDEVIETREIEPELAPAEPAGPQIEQGVPRQGSKRSGVPDLAIPPIVKLNTLAFPFRKMELGDSFKVEVTGHDYSFARMTVMNRSRLKIGRRKYTTALERPGDGTVWLRVWRDA